MKGRETKVIQAGHISLLHIGVAKKILWVNKFQFSSINFSSTSFIPRALSSDLKENLLPKIVPLSHLPCKSTHTSPTFSSSSAKKEKNPVHYIKPTDPSQVSVVQFLQMLLKEGKLSEEQALAYVDAIKRDIELVEEKEAKDEVERAKAQEQAKEERYIQ